LHRQERDRITLGVQFETLVLQALRVFMKVNRKEWPIRYYAVAPGGDVDFVIEIARKKLNAPPNITLIEVKLASKWQRILEGRAFVTEISISYTKCCFKVE